MLIQLNKLAKVMLLPTMITGQEVVIPSVT
jgi:hypothetical protein